MLRLDDPELTQQETTKMLEASWHAAHNDVNDYNNNTMAWSKLLKRDGAANENDEMHPKMQQSETPTIAQRKPEVDNFVQSHTKIESMIAAKVFCPMKQAVTKGIPVFAEDYFEDALECVYYEKARTEALSVV